MSQVNEIKGVVTLDTKPMFAGVQAARRAFRDLSSASTSAGTQMTTSQQNAAKKVIESHLKIETANKNLVNDEKETTRKILESRSKLTTATANRSNAKRTSVVNAEATQSKTANAAAETASRNELRNKQGIVLLAREQVILQDAAARRVMEASKRELDVRKQIFREQQALKASQESSVASLSSMRFTLYAVAAQMAIAGAGMMTFEIASVRTAISWQREFANVSRTVGGSADQISALRQEFVGLAQTIPVSFEELSQIGTLAGQMGIGRADVAGFTQTVAEFGATTGVSVDTSATAFGRLNALLPDVKGNFRKLADSVLNVGINSVSTEASILRIATQLSSIAGGAGYTSTQIIGLSGALASIGMPPELSRGVFARVFGKITQAVSDGGVELQRWGQMSGLSAQQFKDSWNTDASGTFVKVMGGIKDAGAGANAMLGAVGITSVRDRPSLTRLAGALDNTGKSFDSATGKGGLLVQTLKDSEKSSGTLASQYTAIAETVASKLLLVQNNISALFDAVGSGTLGVFGTILDDVNDKIKALTAFASSDFGWILGLAAAIAAIAGVLTIMGGAAAIAFASYIALTQAMVGMSATAGPTGLSMGFLNAQIAATGPLGRVAAGAIRGVTMAMKALSLIGLVLLVPEVGNAINGIIDDINHVDKSFGGLAKRYKNSMAFTVGSNTQEFSKGLVNAGNNIGIFVYDGERQFKDLGDAMAASVEASNFDGLTGQLKVLKKELGLTPQEAVKQFPQLYDALKKANVKLVTASDGAVTFKNAVTGASLGVADLEETLTPAEQAIADFQTQWAETDAAFTSTKGAFDTLMEKQKALAQTEADSSKSTTDTWETFASKHTITTKDFIGELTKQVDAQTSWETDMNNLAGKVTSGTLNELAKLGPEGAGLVHELTTATKPELDKIEKLFADGGLNSASGYAAGLMTIEDTRATLVTAVSGMSHEAKLAFLAEVQAGRKPFKDILLAYGLDAEGNKIPIKADPTDAENTFAEFRLWVKNGGPLYIPIVVTGTSTGSHFLDIWRASEGAKPIRVPSFVMPQKPGSTAGQLPFTGGMMYDTGGYTGDGGMYKPAGIVHKGEFVFTKQATQNLGVGYLYNLMRAGKTGYATGGAVAKSSNSYVPSYGGGTAAGRQSRHSQTQVFELSPVDRQLLRDAGNLQFIIPGVTIAKAVSANNVKSSSRRKA